MMTEQEREELTNLLGKCYSQELSACPNHPIFQPQKAINLLIDWLKQAGYVQLAEDQGLPYYSNTTYTLKMTNAYKQAVTDMLNSNFRRIRRE